MTWIYIILASSDSLCKDAEETTVMAQAILARVFGVTPATMLRAGWRGPLDVRQRTLYGQGKQGQ